MLAFDHGLIAMNEFSFGALKKVVFWCEKTKKGPAQSQVLQLYQPHRLGNETPGAAGVGSGENSQEGRERFQPDQTSCIQVRGGDRMQPVMQV